MRHKLLNLCLSISCLLALLSNASGAACSPQLRFVADEFGRYFFLNTNKQPAGIDYDILTEISRRMHCQMSLEVESNVRLLRRIEAGTADVAAHKIRTPEREKIAWMVPYLQQRNFAIVRKHATTGGKVAFLANKQLNVAVGRSFSHGPGYDNIISQLRDQGRVIEVADINSLYNMLIIRRVQAIFSPPAVYRAMLSKHQIENEFIPEDWVPDDPITILNLMLSKTRFSTEQVHQIEELIKAMQHDGTLQKILKKHLGATDAAKMLIVSPKSK